MDDKQSRKLYTVERTFLADHLTPVSLYLRLRDAFPVSGMLESNDMRSVENCFSFIFAEPISSFKLQQETVLVNLPNGTTNQQKIVGTGQLASQFQGYLDGFTFSENGSKASVRGVFGHCSFESARYFDNFDCGDKPSAKEMPVMRFDSYRYVFAFNHFKEELTITITSPEPVEDSEMQSLVHRFLQANSAVKYPFQRVGEETSNLTDQAYKKLVSLGKEHCQIGDVFQIVMSREFRQPFQGDDFLVYRALRSINPSPYLFYFDYGDYHIFGSSPESQLLIKNGVATINPIAGTYRRTGDDQRDAELARELSMDPKENAEHVMLVDLARNDLGRHATSVRVSSLMETHFYSHVIHLVSKVDGVLPEGFNALEVFGDSFPAGTLSGAPKIKAVELISKYENQLRDYYGGSIGFIGFDGNVNTAIMIRTFFSQDQVLHYQAGAGIVSESDEEKELQEVQNKLGALKNAIIKAETL